MPGSSPPPPEQAGTGVHGTDLAEISRRIVQLQKESFGRGPTKARSFMSENALVCVTEGGYLPAERTLRDAGHEGLVSEQRGVMQEVMRSTLIAEVEKITGRRVKAFMSATDDEAEMSAEIFVFEEQPELDLGSEDEALRGWSDQVRRQARELRDEQVRLREEQARRRAERPPTS
jgi:uncharacterized protein YbcI